MESKEERLLNAIFNGAEDEPDDNYPETWLEKVGYAEFVATKILEPISSALWRLSRLHHLLMLEEKDATNKLPDIITNNELRMALKPLLQVKNDINEIVPMLLVIYRSTKHEIPKTPELEAVLAGQKRGCENCGNQQCANGPIAFNWDECVKSKFEKHWRPKEG